MFWRCFRTVPGLRSRILEIAQFALPLATQESTSTSRGVSLLEFPLRVHGKFFQHQANWLARFGGNHCYPETTAIMLKHERLTAALFSSEPPI